MLARACAGMAGTAKEQRCGSCGDWLSRAALGCKIGWQGRAKALDASSPRCRWQA